MKKCQFCQEEFTPKSKKARFCSDKCRVYYNRNINESVEKQDVIILEGANDTGLTLRNKSLDEYLEEYESVYLKKRAPSYANQKKWDQEREKRLNELKIIIKSYEKAEPQV